MYDFVSLDLGFSTSFVFLPLVIFEFIDLINRNNDYLKLSSGISLMLFSQIPAVVITCLFLLAWLFININKLNFKLIINLFKAVILSILITSIFWV